MIRPTQTGLDTLVAQRFAPLRGLRVGLVTNHTGRNADGVPTADLLHQAPHVYLAALFGPEHGIRGTFDQPTVDDARDPATGLPVYSLYGARTAPTPEQMQGLDAFVYDIQDIGCRFYTYISTLKNVLVAASDASLPVYVLDRPNPITACRAEGPLPDLDKMAFVVPHPVPVRHGLTAGEMARLLHAELGLRCPLSVVPCAAYTRRDWFDHTGLPWTNPSPNMRSLTQALLYPGIGLLEFTNISVGRGTDTPFEMVGAPWLDARAVAAAVNAQGVAGVRVYPAEFTPRASVFANELCHGLHCLVTDREAFPPVMFGIALALALRRCHAHEWDTAKMTTLLAHQATADAVLSGGTYDDICAAWEPDLASFAARASAHRLYE